MLADCWLVCGLVFFYYKIETKNLMFFLAVDWLHGWRLPSLLSWSVVGWLVLAKRLTECLLTVDWWVAQCFFNAKLRLKKCECMAGGSPLCLAGRLIGFGKETDIMLADCWLVGGSVFFYCKIETQNLMVFFLAVDWLHGWRLPSLLSWSVVSWLVLAKRLTECWLTVRFWVARCFITAKLRLNTWRFF